MTQQSFSLLHTKEGLKLKSSKKELGRDFLIDYEKGPLGYRLTQSRVFHEPLAKMVDKESWVFDATGGMLKDAFIMALLGCKVWSSEAHPLIIELVQDGLSRAKNNPQWKNIIEDRSRFRFFALDSRLILEEFLPLNKQLRPDIIYLDPMFPQKRKFFPAKREIKWIQTIHEATASMYPHFKASSPEIIFELALKIAQKRVIVKRPLYAPNLVNNPVPSFRRDFQSSRFDVYLTG